MQKLDTFVAVYLEVQMSGTDNLEIILCDILWTPIQNKCQSQFYTYWILQYNYRKLIQKYFWCTAALVLSDFFLCLVLVYFSFYNFSFKIFLC